MAEQRIDEGVQIPVSEQENLVQGGASPALPEGPSAIPEPPLTRDPDATPADVAAVTTPEQFGQLSRAEQDKFQMEKLRERESGVLQDPNISNQEKLAIIQEGKLQEQGIRDREIQEEAALREGALSEQREKIGKFTAALEEAELLNKELVARGLPEVAVPQPEEFGIAPDQMFTPATPEDAAIAAAPTKGEVEAEAQGVRQELAKGAAQEQELAKQEIQKAAKIKSAEDVVKKEDEEDTKTAEREQAAGSSTFNKIMVALSVGLGAAGAALTGGENTALKIMQINAQKEAEKKKLSQKAADRQVDLNFKMMEIQIKKENLILSQQTKSSQAQSRLIRNQKMLVEIDAKQEERRGKRVVGQLITAQGGVTRDQYDQLLRENPEEGLKLQEKAVFLPGDKVVFASEQGAKELRKEIPTALDNISSLGRLLEINEQFLGGSLDITGARREAGALSKMLVGAMRVAIVGPGALSQHELKLLDQIVRNPTNIFSLKASNKTALDAVMAKIKSNIRTKLEINGVTLPPSVNEKNVKTMMRKSKRSRGEVISLLNEQGKWRKEALPF